jgi:hypothetical protein
VAKRKAESLSNPVMQENMVATRNDTNLTDFDKLDSILIKEPTSSSSSSEGAITVYKAFTFTVYENCVLHSTSVRCAGLFGATAVGVVMRVQFQGHDEIEAVEIKDLGAAEAFHEDLIP